MRTTLADIGLGILLAFCIAAVLVKAVILRDCSLTSMVCSEDGGVP